MFLEFFILKFLKSETLLVFLAEAMFVVLSVALSLKLHNQFGFRACEKFFTNRAVPLLFKCNLLLLRHEPSILVLLMDLIPLPLHKFSNFLLTSLISSSKSWSWRCKVNKSVYIANCRYRFCWNYAIMLPWKMWSSV